MMLLYSTTIVSIVIALGLNEFIAVALPAHASHLPGIVYYRMNQSIFSAEYLDRTAVAS